jgi:membrane-associated phospholipid phosphatase
MSMAAAWNFVTDFGDIAVTAPLATLMAGFLVAARRPPLAIAWGAAIIGCAGAIGLLKLALVDCGRPLAGPVLASPSGHTAMSIAVYGGFAAIVGTRLALPARAAAMAGALSLAIGIALSRLVLRDHNAIEVAVGLAVGSAALVVIAVSVGRERPATLPVGYLLAAAVVVALIFHGERWPAEPAIHRLALWLNALRPWCG